MRQKPLDSADSPAEQAACERIAREYESLRDELARVRDWAGAVLFGLEDADTSSALGITSRARDMLARMSAIDVDAVELPEAAH